MSLEAIDARDLRAVIVSHEQEVLALTVENESIKSMIVHVDSLQHESRSVESEAALCKLVLLLLQVCRRKAKVLVTCLMAARCGAEAMQ